ncbi:MAG: hypothetical protein HYZ42_09870 [Bacteroidetes bacterium]|nr:hypothetical protein [Bacteroidota bacterium]
MISMPGDVYTFKFELPTDQNYDLFLYTQGYYLEWMREHWIKDKDLPKLKQLLSQPSKFLKSESANYKKYDKYMEQEFWNSKIDANHFTYNEK